MNINSILRSQMAGSKYTEFMGDVDDVDDVDNVYYLLNKFLDYTILTNIWNGTTFITKKHDFNILILQIIHYHRMSTTTKTKLSTASCRLWQLLYIIFYEWFLKNPIDTLEMMTNTYQLPVSKASLKMLKNIKNDLNIVQINVPEEYPLPIEIVNLNKIIFNNDNFNTNGNDEYFQNIYSFSDLNQPLDTNGIYNYCLCLNFQQIEGDVSGVNKILHYFTIINKVNDNDNEWYINSSYSSDSVKVPQYSIKLDIEEFQQFLDYINISDYEIEENSFSELFMKYFLLNQKSWHKDRIDAEDMCDPWYKCAQMLPDLSIENSEMKYIRNNNYIKNLKVSWIKPYTNIINQLINIH